MWFYEKKLLIPTDIKRPNPRMAKLLLSQYGGPNGELTAGIGYINQRYGMNADILKAVLTDIGTEELAHWELIGAMIYQCLKNASASDLRQTGLETWSENYGKGIFPCDANGLPWSASAITATGDAIADITQDMAAEQKSRALYEGLIRQCDDPDILQALNFLREREIVHFQRFGEALCKIQNSV